MRCRFWASVLVVGLATGSAIAQGAPRPVTPAAAAGLVRVQIGHTGGMCGGSGYCTNLTTVDRRFVVSQLMDAPNKEKFPDVKAKRAITQREWEILQYAIDRKSLTALPPGVCEAVIDLPCSWVQVEFGDGTKIGIFYDSMHPPAPVAALLKKVPGVAIPLPVP